WRRAGGRLTSSDAGAPRRTFGWNRSDLKRKKRASRTLIKRIILRYARFVKVMQGSWHAGTSNRAERPGSGCSREGFPGRPAGHALRQEMGCFTRPSLECLGVLEIRAGTAGRVGTFLYGPVPL